MNFKKDKVMHCIGAAVLTVIALIALYFEPWTLPLLVNHAFWGSREAKTIEVASPLLPLWQIHIGRGWLWDIHTYNGEDSREDYLVSMIVAVLVSVIGIIIIRGVG